MPDAESADHLRRPVNPEPLDGFHERLFSHAGMTHPVYRSGSGPAVLVLHEATGLSPHAVDLGRRLIHNGFTAYLPLFFGRPYHGTLRGAVRLFCIQREFRLFASNQTSPIADWLRGLCWRADQDSGRQGVAVVGMCLTGGVALATVVRPEVRAVVSAQPALPVPLRPRRGQASACRKRT